MIFKYKGSVKSFMKKKGMPPSFPPVDSGMPKAGGDGIGVGIENNRATALALKTKKTVFHNSHKPAIAELFFFTEGRKGYLHEKM